MILKLSFFIIMGLTHGILRDILFLESEVCPKEFTAQKVVFFMPSRLLSYKYVYVWHNKQVVNF
jgi:hypothetical protein